MIVSNCRISLDEVADHYNELDRFYRRVWGRHVHHGLWISGRESPAEAVEQLIETTVAPLQLDENSRVCDVGCGYGETARYLAKRFGATVTGITLSQTQFDFACQQNAEDTVAEFVLGDWESNSLPAASFDAVVSIECLAHIVNKPVYFEQINRVLRPGGRAAITCWLEGDHYRPWQQRWLLEPICREGRLPSMGRMVEYAQMATDAGLAVVECADWSDRVRKTWRICSRRVMTQLATRPDAWWFLMRRKSRSWVFLFSIWRIRLAYRTGAMRYGMMLVEKPQSTATSP